MRKAIVAVAAVLAMAAAHVDAADNAADAEKRSAQIETIIKIGEEAIANPNWLESDAWRRFIDELRGQAMQGLSDAEFRSWFNGAAGNLPFTHWRLFWKRQPGKGSSGAPRVEAREVAAGVALLRVERFDDVESMKAAIGNVLHGEYQDLVIDLRGNEGGSFPSVVTLVRSLTGEAVDGGVFLTRKWFDQHDGYPDATQRESIPALQSLNLAAFSRQLQETGALRLVLPSHDDPVFEGRVVILTDADTGSAAEPFVYLMQKRGAQVIGKRTAGAMLSAERMAVDDTFVLFVPVADYMAPDGKRLDRAGVTPDIQILPERALDTALKYLGNARR